MSRLQCILLTCCIVVGSLAAVPKPTQIQVLAKHGGAAQVHFLTASATTGEPHSTTGMIQVDRNGDLDIGNGDGGAAGAAGVGAASLVRAGAHPSASARHRCWRPPLSTAPAPRAAAAGTSPRTRRRGGSRSTMATTTVRGASVELPPPLRALGVEHAP